MYSYFFYYLLFIKQFFILFSFLFVIVLKHSWFFFFFGFEHFWQRLNKIDLFEQNASKKSFLPLSTGPLVYRIDSIDLLLQCPIDFKPFNTRTHLVNGFVSYVVQYIRFGRQYCNHKGKF